MSKMSREEMLCRRLIKHYKLSMKVDESSMALKPRGPGVYWSDPCVYIISNHEWKYVLFGAGECRKTWTDLLKRRMSLTDFIRHMANSWKACRDRVPLLLDFKTLDELDIQLTLAGANHD